MAQLYKIMIRCPLTKLEIDTGIRTSGREVLISNIYQNGMVNCPHCNQFHKFEGNAFLKIETESPADSLWRPNP